MGTIHSRAIQILVNKGEIEMREKETNCKKTKYPKLGTEYWNILCQVWANTWCDHFIDKTNFDTGNYFETKEQADSEFEWRWVNTRILRSIADINKEEGWVADWDDYNQSKWYMRVDAYGWCPSADCAIIHRHYETNRYLSDDGIDELCDLHTAEELKFWLTKEK